MPENQRRIFLAVAVLAVGIAACGGRRALPAPGDSTAPGARGDEPAPPEPPAIVKEYPALAEIAARPSWVAGVRRLEDARALARDLLEVGTVAVPASAGARPDQLDEQARQRLGASPLTADGLRALGLDPDGTAALYGAPILPGVVLPVADRAAVARAVGLLRPQTASARRAADGREWAAWSVAPDQHVVYWLDDDWLSVRVARGPVATQAPARLGWDVASAALDEADAWARDAAGPGLTAFAWADPQPLATGFEALMGASPCARGIALELPSVRIAARAASADEGWGIEAEVGVADPGGLTAIAVPEPPPGFAAYRDTVGLAAEVGVDLRALRRRVSEAGCSAAAAELAAVERQLGAAAGAHAVRAAIEGLTSDVARLRGAAWLGVHDPAPLRRALGRVPGFLQRTRTIAGYRVRIIDVPMVPFLAYVDRGRQFVLAAGKGTVERALAAPASAPAPAPLAGVDLRPAGFRDPAEAIRTVASLANVPGVAPAELDRRLRSLFARYELLTVRAFAGGDRVRLRARGEARVPRPRASL